MPEDTILVRLVTNPSTTETFKEIIRFSEGFELQEPGDKQRPDLLILELSRQNDAQFALIESLRAKNSVGDIFLTSKNIEPDILRRAMRLGVKEFFPLPLPIEEIKQALKEFKHSYSPAPSPEQTEQGCKIIQVMGSKGGVGTTTIAVNLAVNLALRKSRPRVALVDMNFVFGEVPAFLDVKPLYHWGEISRNIDRLDKTFLASVMTRHSSGVDVLASPSYLNEQERTTSETARQIFTVMRESYDFIVVDSGHSIDDTCLTILEMVNYLLLVSVLSIPCLANTNKLLQSLKKLGYPLEQVKVLANRWMKKTDISLTDAEAGIGQSFFSVLPNDYFTTMTAINVGKPPVDLAPKSEISKAIKRLTDSLLPEGKRRGSTKARKFFGLMRR